MTTNDESEAGRTWVLERLQSLAAKAGLAVENHRWDITADDLRSPVQTRTLSFFIDGKRTVELFNEADLEDLPADTGVREALERRLRELLSGSARS